MLSKINQRISADLRTVLDLAGSEAEHRHGNYVDVEHLLLGLLHHPNGPTSDLFRRHDINTQALYDEVAASVGMERSTPMPVKGYSKSAQNTIERAADEARLLNQSHLSTGHLLLALMAEPFGVVHEVLAKLPLTPDEVRHFLREMGDGGPAVSPASLFPKTDPRGEAEILVVPARAPKRKRGEAAAPRRRNWPLVALVGLALLAYLAYALPGTTLFTFVFVLVGWVFSVTLHEFAHALVAYLGGDYTVKDKGYLTFNPLKYTHPLLSIGLPLLFLAMGGIGLPGGAVYIERHRLRSKWWGAAVSAAGPAANLLLALLLALPFMVGLVDPMMVGGNIAMPELRDRHPGASESFIRQMYHLDPPSIWNNPTLWTAVAFLALLQVTAVAFNLLPIPPLDGFGIIEPLLDPRTVYQLRQIGMFSLLLIFLLMSTSVGGEFLGEIYRFTGQLKIPDWLINEGARDFMFWRYR